MPYMYDYDRELVIEILSQISAHHYFDIDTEEIYFVCDQKLEKLSNTVDRMKQDLLSS